MATTGRAIIIGGGIGGLAAALALRQQGWTTEVYERLPRLAEVGAGLMLWANALRALDILGVADAIRALKPPAPSVGLYTSSGKPLLLGSVDTLERSVGEISIVVHRAELLDILRAAYDDRLFTGRSCVGVEQDTQGVHAAFAGGTTAEGDILIGADGIRSVVRTHLIGDGEPRYGGYTSYRAVTTFDHPRLRPGEYWGCGARFGIAPMSEGRVYWFATRNAPPRERTTPSETHARLLQTFGSWCEPVGTLIEATPPETILHHDIVDRPPRRGWSKGRMTLLGDAAHPMTPNMGQGACQALEDAVVLGRCLAGSSDIAAALQHYEQRRYDRTRLVVEQSRRIGQVGQWESRWVCAVRNRVIRAVAPVQYLGVRRVVGYRLPTLRRPAPPTRSNTS